MQKGFLCSNSTKKKDISVSSSQTKSSVREEITPDIPLIKPKHNKKEELKLPEVQEAMKSSQTLLNNKGKVLFVYLRVFALHFVLWGKLLYIILYCIQVKNVHL